MKFLLNDENAALRYQYEDNNYKDIVLGGGQNCIIFFSGNGLYYPNSEEVFTETIMKNDHYEWENTAKAEEITDWADRIIFIRDIYKSWYVKGINRKINSIEKMITWLKELTTGYYVITCGNSAGGYIAALVGSRIGAKKIYSFGGQWDLAAGAKKNFILHEFMQESDQAEKLDLFLMLKQNVSPIFWFYSAKCEEDKKQFQFFKDHEIPNVYVFAVDSAYHGQLLLGGCNKKILILETKRLIKLCEKYSGKMIDRKRFCLELMRIKEAFPYWEKDIIENHKSLQIVIGFCKKR